MKKLYFFARRECGYSKQVIINLDLKMISTGYCLFNNMFVDSVRLPSQKELNNLVGMFKNQGFMLESDFDCGNNAKKR